MKPETSITISEDILDSIDSVVGENVNRSEFIESVLRDFLDQFKRTASYLKDLEILNKHADRLNKEAIEVLDYQVKI